MNAPEESDQQGTVDEKCVLCFTGVNVIGPVATGELLNLTNPSSGCRYSCPFNVADDYPYVRQPCVYTVRVMEAFKGNYSVSRRRKEGTG